MPSLSRKELLVLASLDLIAREARGVEDEHHLEPLLGSVGHQAVEVSAPVGLAPAGVEVDVLVDEVEVVLSGESLDRLALGVGREALALFLGRLAHVRDGSQLGRRCGVRRVVDRVGATSPRTTRRRRRSLGLEQCRAHRSSPFPWCADDLHLDQTLAWVSTRIRRVFEGVLACQ
jgi:hypothetical protein